MGEGKKPVEKGVREKFLDNFKGKIFLTKNPESTLEKEPEENPEPAAFASPETSKETAKISQCRLSKGFFEKFAHYEANISTKICSKYFKHQSLSFLLKHFENNDECKNEKSAKHVNNAMINLGNAVKKKKIAKNY